MSNGISAPVGFQPQDSITSTTYNLQPANYQISTDFATSLFQGDPVILSGGYLARKTATTVDGTVPLLGIFVGCSYYDANNVFQQKNMWTASTSTFTGTSIWGQVIVDPNVRFSVQTGITGTTVATAITNAGLGARFNYGTGNTTTGMSGAYLDQVGLSTNTNYYDFIVDGFTPLGANSQVGAGGSFNGWGASFTDLLVVMNNTKFKKGQNNLA